MKFCVTCQQPMPRGWCALHATPKDPPKKPARKKAAKKKK